MSEKFPERVTECFSMGGLRIDYFRNDSPAFEATQEVDRGREYISLQEHQEKISQLEEMLRQTELKHQHIVMASKRVFKWFTPTDLEHPVGKLRTAVEELANIKEKI